MLDEMLEYHSYACFLRSGDRTMGGTKVMGKHDSYTLINTPDIYIPAGGSGYTFAAAGTYLVICTWNLEVDQNCTFSTDFKVNGTSVFETIGIHCEDGHDPKDQTAQVLLEFKRGDILTIETTMDTGSGTMKQGSSIVIMKAKGAYSHTRYTASQGSFVTGGTENPLGDSDNGGTIANLTEDMVYTASTGMITPGTGVSTSRPYFLLATAMARLESSTDGFIRHGIEVDGALQVSPYCRIDSSYDPSENTVSTIKTVEHGDGIRFFIQDQGSGTDLATLLEKGAAFTAFDISNGGAIEDHAYAAAKCSNSPTVAAGATFTLFSDAAGGLNHVAEESGIDYDDSDGTFTISKAGVDVAAGDFYITANIRGGTVGLGESLKTVEVKNNGSVIYTSQFYLDNILDQAFDMTVSFIARLEINDVITFHYTNHAVAGTTTLRGGNSANIFRLSNLKDANSYLFKGSRNLLREDGMFDGGPDGLIQKDFDINTHKKQDQRFRVVDQSPTILGTSGPPSIRGRVKRSLPFRVAGPKGGKK
jgi:hypothetical protein